MNTNTSTLKRHSLVIVITLMFLFTWPVELSNSGLLPFQLPFLVTYLVGYGIVFATLVMTGLTLGRQGVVDLLKRYLIWRVGWNWYLAPFLLVPLIYLIVLILNAAINQAPIDFSTTFASNFFGPDANLVLLVIPFLISDAITNGEEIGWRGYVLPRLQVKYNALNSSLILGLIWGFWHLLKPAYIQDPVLFGWFLVQTMALAVVYTWIYNNTKGSLLLVTLFHAANNTAAFFLPLSNTVTSDLGSQIIESLAWLAVAVVVVWVAGPDRLSRSASKQVEGQKLALEVTG
jgi:membrane protease YdiL (CAAX protease family)